MEKANHGEHGGHGENQTTEGTENTEIGKEGADTLVRPYRAWHWCEQRAVGKGGQGRLKSRPQARKPAPQRGIAATKQAWWLWSRGQRAPVAA